MSVHVRVVFVVNGTSGLCVEASGVEDKLPDAPPVFLGRAVVDMSLLDADVCRHMVEDDDGIHYVSRIVIHVVGQMPVVHVK